MVNEEDPTGTTTTSKLPTDINEQPRTKTNRTNILMKHLIIRHPRPGRKGVQGLDRLESLPPRHRQQDL
jgi:hypothetical protein